MVLISEVMVYPPVVIHKNIRNRDVTIAHWAHKPFQMFMADPLTQSDIPMLSQTQFLIDLVTENPQFSVAG